MWERVAPGEENSVGKGTRVETRPGLCLQLSKLADGERVRAPTSGGWGAGRVALLTRPLQRLCPISAKGDLLGSITG